MCDHGCAETDQILQLESALDCGDIDEGELHPDEILSLRNAKNYACYNATALGDYGHENYAAAAYAATLGHLDCLKQIHKNDGMWHSDLAIVAAEHGQFACLKYIVETMGDVDCNEDNFKNVSSKECLEYMQKHFLAK